MRRQALFLLMVFCLPVSSPAFAAEDKPWGFWTKNEQEKVSDSGYSGKPSLSPGAEIEEKRREQEDIRRHVQSELKNADLTTEKGRRAWDEKSREIKRKRMEEIREAKRQKAEASKKARPEALKRKRGKPDEAPAAAEAPSQPPAPAVPKVQIIEVPSSGSGGENP